MSRPMQSDLLAAQFPRTALRLAGAAVLLALVGAVAGRFIGHTDVPHGVAAIATRDLRFEDGRAEDGEAGAIVISDAASNGVVSVMPAGTNGFLRATLRGLARGRRQADPQDGAAITSAPFRLTAWADGRLSLADPIDGRSIDLEAFGVTNAQVFAKLLTAQVVRAAEQAK